MMKRMLKRMLALAIGLFILASVALAQDAEASSGGNLLPENGQGTLMVKSVAVLDDAVYILTVDGGQAVIWHWQEGMAQAEACPDNLLYAPRFNSTEEAEQAVQNLFAGETTDAAHAISLLLTDGEKLYGYNGLEHLVFEIDDSGDALKFTDLGVLNWPGANAYQAPITVLKQDEWLLWLETDQNSRNYSERLLAFNLVTGAVKQAVLPELSAISSYKDGKILVLCRAKYKQTVYTYDPRTDLTECLGTLEIDDNPRFIAYSDALDKLVYKDKTRVMGWSPEEGSKQLGFVPMTSRSYIDVMGDKLIWRSQYERQNEIYAAHLRPDYATAHSLVILSEPSTVPAERFHSLYPDVPFYFLSNSGMTSNTYEEYTQILDDEAPDLLYLFGNNLSYGALKENGHLLDLSAYPAIREYVDRLYPVFRDLVEENDAIYGVPVYASSYNGWFINKEVMKAMGLTVEDIPTSLTEMCAFATRWNNEFAEKYPHYTLLNDTTNYRERLLEAMLEAWSGYCQYHGQALNFDDPIFFQLLSALDAAELNELDAALKQTDPEVSEYKQALIWTGIKTVGNWATYMEDFSDRVYIPLTLTPDTPLTVGVESVSLWSVNSASDNADYAAAMIEELLSEINLSRAYVLCSDLTEPIENAGYAEQLAYEQDVLASLESYLAESVNKAAAEKQIADQKEYIETVMAQNRYEINPSAIENYRSVIEPATYISLPDALTGERTAEMYDCIKEYAYWKIDAEEFVAELKRLCK